MTTTLTENKDAKTGAAQSPEEIVAAMGTNARRAATGMAKASLEAKNRALLAIADALVAQTPELQKQNQLDLEAGKEAGLTSAMLDRLELTDKRIEGMAQGLREVAALPDPVGEMFDFRVRPNGLRIGKMRVPIGVIGIVYESRPNVTADAAALCLKSGNACILRGGKEAYYSNTAIAKTIRSGLVEAGLPEDAVQLVATTDRAVVGALCASPEAVDCIIPRGGKGLIKAVMAAAHVPVIKHLDGVCHVYIHPTADLEKGASIALNAKTQRTGVCNSLETLLLDSTLPREFIADLLRRYIDAGVELRGCERTKEIGGDQIITATEEDWTEEYLAKILAVKIVDGLDEAIAHINTYGSQHTDTIVAQDYSATWHFLQQVDSACVHINASTRFSDGAEYGLGCEIGISTDKLHARGPMGLTELTSVKWVVFGDGQIRT